ncbi:MAG: hypothetical protein ACYS8W_18000 [Planctomycetota bacterium]
MLRQVLPKSKKLGKLSENIVFILGHKENNREAFDKTNETYLPQFFYTPSYIFLDSKGNMHFPEITEERMHKMFQEDRLADTLKNLLKKNGKGISRKRRQEICGKIDKAEKLLKDGKPDNAVKEFEALSKAKNISHALKERVLRRIMEIADEKILKEEEARLKKEAPPADDTLEHEFHKTYVEAVTAALKGNYIKAREEFAYLIDTTDEDKDNTRLVEMHKRIEKQCRDAFVAGRIKTTRLRIEGQKEKYWEAGVMITTKLPVVEEIVVQFWALTEKGEVFAGYQTYENVKKGLRHQVAAYIPYSKLTKTRTAKGYDRYDSVVDVHYTIYVSREAVASRNLVEKPEKEWWKTADAKQLTFFHDPGWGWDSGTMKPTQDFGLFYEQPETPPEEEKKENK